MTSFAAGRLTVPAQQQRVRRTGLLHAVRVSVASVVDSYRAAAAHERSLAAASGRRVLDDVTSGPYRTIL